MHQTTIMEIIGICREIDETARDIYARFASLSTPGALSSFWSQMSREEAEHVAFWKRAEMVEKFSGLPPIFDAPEKVAEELRNALLRSKTMLSRCGESYSIASALALAYRMEFYLLHPAFEILFHLLGPTAGGWNPEEDYASHIAKFIAMLEKHGNVTPELELLGETIERLWKENKYLAIQSTRDDLTGLLNRRGFFTLSVQFAHLAQRTGSDIAVMMIDLDHFKSVNDRLGHVAGDRVLKETARLLTQGLRESDLVGRYGGEEFIVLLTDVAYDTAGSLAEKIRKNIESNPPDGVPVTVSIGFAEATLGSEVQEEFNSLIQKADAALYKAKETGRNRVVEYQPEEQSHPNNQIDGDS